MDNIDTVAGSLKKRLEEMTATGVPAHLIVRSTEITMDKDLSNLDEKALTSLVSKLAALDVRMTKTANGLEFAWSEEDEGEERFDVPEEEEAEEEATTRVQQMGGRGGAAGGRGATAARGRRSGNRGRPRPRPEPLKVLDVSQIHGFGEVLGNITAQRLAYENWTRKKLVLVGANQPVERALSRINTHNILSLPVVDDTNSNGAVIGLLDVLDIIAALSEAWESTGRPQRREILFTPISDIMAKKTNPTYLVSITTPLLEVIKQYAKGGITRVMIVDRALEKNFCQQEKPEEMVVGLLTESDLVRFVAENFMWIKREKLFQQSLRDLGLGNRKPITVDQNVQAYQAFLEIHKHGSEGAAMVDSSGKLMANVSASNIKGMTRRNFQLLSRPLLHFLSRDRKRGWWHLPVCTSLDTTFETVILQFVATKIHRMYIVDDEGKPIGEISLSDVIHQLANL
jgi:CBS domain-containing protein